MNDHADSPVDVTSGAGAAEATVHRTEGSIAHAGDADAPVRGTRDPVDEGATPDDSVGKAVSRLDELDSTDVSEHPAIYEDIHRTLASALDDTPTTGTDR